MVYRPMEHPHFVLAGLAALAGLGAEPGDQLDLWSVDWDKLKAKGNPHYRLALLAEERGKAIGYKQADIDTAIRMLYQHEAINLFRVFFGFYPQNETRRQAEWALLKVNSPTTATWYTAQTISHLAQLRGVLKNDYSKVVTAAELAAIAKRGKWTDQQLTDALTGDNVYQIRPKPPIPWLYIGAASAAGVALAWWMWRRRR